MSEIKKILIIDDEEIIHSSIKKVLRRIDCDVVSVLNGNDGLELMAKESFDLVLQDLILPGEDGLELLKKIKEKKPDLPVIVISGYGTVQSAVKAMKFGAVDFLAKPFRSEELCKIVEKVTRNKDRTKVKPAGGNVANNNGQPVKVIYKSEAMALVLKMAGLAAPTDSTVLITGESGTGKGLLARLIHQKSARAGNPFVAVDCGTLVETLFESELFGHVRGAFTGAEGDKIGKFEQADSGTIFFDEISNISLDIQAKLLKAVEEREISRVGSINPVHVDVRILAATNTDILPAIQQGTFREDLYYRLHVVSIHMPPLRERPVDIPPLVDFFLDMFTSQQGIDSREISPEALELLIAHDWPGNVRELSNTIERLVVLGTSKIILPEDLNLVQRLEGFPLNPDTMTLGDMERDHIRMMLLKYQGKKQETADALGINRGTLREKMKRYELE